MARVSLEPKTHMHFHDKKQNPPQIGIKNHQNSVIYLQEFQREHGITMLMTKPFQISNKVNEN